MKIYIIIILATISFNAAASSISIFMGEDNQGITLSKRYGQEIVYKFDLTNSKKLRGIGASIGNKFDNISIFIGIGLSHGEGFHKSVSINDVDVRAYGTSKGLSNYLEVEYSSFYIRYNKFDLKYKYSGYLDTGTDILSDSHIENISGDITWIGYRYKF